LLQSSESTIEAIQDPIPPMSDICCYAKAFMA
jgi:hypothetical protein